MKFKMLIGAGIMAVLALAGGVAMACVPSASIKVAPGSGKVGDEVKVTGSTFDPAGSQVNIYWDGVRGMPLGSVAVQPDKSFSYTFKVPNGASGGTHVVSATQRDSQGQSYNPVNATYSVSGAPKPATASNLQGPARSQQVASAPAPQQQSAPAPAAQPSAQAASGQAPPAAPVSGGQAAPPAAAPPAQGVGLPGSPPPAGPAADGSSQPATASDAFRTPVVAPDAATASAPGSEGTPAWMLGGLAALALGLFGAGTGIFAAERKRTRVPVEAE
ncbi:MAG: hypothetical protein M3O23_03175 [Actinomycetota bacterium]|nr:hypothetical protein [Actinomycetota bacterium]